MISGKKKRLNIRRCLPLCMLVVYATTTIGVDLLHQTLHHHHAHTIFSDTAGINDLCHSVKRDDRGHDDARQAFITPDDTCAFSHIVFQANQLVCATPALAQHRCKANTEYTIYYFTVSGSSTHQSKLRGPPVA